VVEFEVLEPATVTLPAEVGQLMILNRAPVSFEVINEANRGNMEVEQLVMIDTLVSNSTFRGLLKVLQQSPIERFRRPFWLSERQFDTASLQDLILTKREVTALCEQYGADSSHHGSGREDGFTRHITQIDDYLPPGIEYTANSTSGLTTADPDTEYVTVNGVDRWQLTWDQNVMGGKVQIEAGANLTLTFVAQAALGISGTYYNEVLVQPESLAEYKIYTDIDPELDIYELLGHMYSWNSGTIIVPAYDASTGAEGKNVTSNIGIEPGGIRIISWN